MNILFFVFSIGLILSYSFYACWDKHLSSDLLRETYVGHEKVNRKLTNSDASDAYAAIASKTPEKEAEEIEDEEEDKKVAQSKTPPKKNAECARINLWPLINEGITSHPHKYELAARILKQIYQPMGLEPDFEYKFLDAIIAAASHDKQEMQLQKLDLEALQDIYYNMLKGSKGEYPRFIDYFKISKDQTDLCYYHMHPGLASCFFGEEVAWELHYEIHKRDGETPRQELVENKCREKGQDVNSSIFALFKWGGRHKKNEATSNYAEDTKSWVGLHRESLEEKAT